LKNPIIKFINNIYFYHIKNSNNYLKLLLNTIFNILYISYALKIK
jgi:hypothetical protein